MASATAQKVVERVAGRAMGSSCVAEWLGGCATLLLSARFEVPAFGSRQRTPSIKTATAISI